MGKYTSADVAFLLVDGCSILGLTTKIHDEGTEGIFDDATALGDKLAHSDYAGIKECKFAQEGWYSDAAGATNDALVAGIGTDRIVSFGFAGNAAGADFIGGLTKQATYKRGLELEKFHRANAEYLVNERDDGLIVAALATRTAGASTAAVDFGAAATAAALGANCYLQLPALTLGGYTNLPVLVEHSTTGSSAWTTLGAFVVCTTSPQAQRINFTGTVKRFLRVTHSWTGAGTGQGATFAVGVGLT